MRVFKGLLTSNWALGFPKYTTGFQSHTLWFSLFLVVARRSSRSDVEHDLVVVAFGAEPHIGDEVAEARRAAAVDNDRDFGREVSGERRFDQRAAQCGR